MKAVIPWKKPAFWLFAAAAAIGIASLTAYSFANKAMTGSVAAVYIFGVAGIACEALGVFYNKFAIPAIAAPAAFALCFIFELLDNATSFMLQAFGVAQGTGEMGAPNGAFWFCMVAFLAAAAVAAAAAFFPRINIEKSREAV